MNVDFRKRVGKFLRKYIDLKAIPHDSIKQILDDILKYKEKVSGSNTFACAKADFIVFIYF